MHTVSMDANAAAPVSEVAWLAYQEASALYADPRSHHAAGREAHQMLIRARQRIAAVLRVNADELTFTSGGTESNAALLLAVCQASSAANLPHCVISAIEHPAIGSTVKILQQRGLLAATVVPVARHGCVATQDMAAAIKPCTVLMSVVAACNETGVLQDLPALAHLCRQRKVLLHTDAVQALGRVAIDPTRWGVHYMTLSGHKIGAVGGAGLLYVRRGASAVPALHGRPASVAGVVSLAAAMDTLPTAAAVNAMECLRDRFEQALVAAVPFIEILGRQQPRLANTSCVRFDGCSGDGLMMALDLKGFAVSTGSACSSGSLEPSEILLGMGLSRQHAQQTVRFSFAVTTTWEMLASVVQHTAHAVAMMRSHAAAKATVSSTILAPL